MSSELIKPKSLNEMIKAKNISHDFININDLSETEKTLSLVLLNNLVKTTEDDLELAKEIRRIFSVINQ
jgi:hypothetical protein